MNREERATIDRRFGELPEAHPQDRDVAERLKPGIFEMINADPRQCACTDDRHLPGCPFYTFVPQPPAPAFRRRSRFADFRMLYVRGAIAIACGFAYAWLMWAVVRTAQNLGAF